MQEGARHLLKLESTGDCPRTNNGAHLIEMPDESEISKGRLPWCVQCGIEFNRMEAELLAIVFAATIPAATVRKALESYDLALSEAEAILGGEYGDYHAHLMEAVDKARTMRAALGLGAEGEKR